MNYKCLILIAAHNGISWIGKQIASILDQQNVVVNLLISDDGSTDGTFEMLCEFAKNDCRIRLLPRTRLFGSAGKNFYHLLSKADISDFDYIAFSDQDDVWAKDKLSRHIALAKEFKADGVSSNVMAFWSDGRQRLIDKAQPQKQYDFLFESAGPGCTFLMTPWLVGKVREQLLSEGSMAKEVCLHDWLTYAICRAYGRQWVIDSTPSVYYRQHGNNVLGANSGFKAKWARLLKLKQGWYRAELQKICQVCTTITKDEEIKKINKLLQAKTLKSQFHLIAYAAHARRKLTDRVVLMALMLFFLF